MSTETSQKISRSDLSPSLLRKKYLDENLSLIEASEFFGIPVGTLRKRLAHYGIFKTQKMAGQNAAKTRRARISEGVTYPKSSPEILKTVLCAEKGIFLAHVWESDWKSDQLKVLEVLRRTVDLRKQRKSPLLVDKMMEL